MGNGCGIEDFSCFLFCCAVYLFLSRTVTVTTSPCTLGMDTLIVLYELRHATLHVPRHDSEACVPHNMLDRLGWMDMDIAPFLWSKIYMVFTHRGPKASRVQLRYATMSFCIDTTQKIYSGMRMDTLNRELCGVICLPIGTDSPVQKLLLVLSSQKHG